MHSLTDIIGYQGGRGGGGGGYEGGNGSKFPGPRPSTNSEGANFLPDYGGQGGYGGSNGGGYSGY